jgi:outer membrane murein-binding lipoprotein Lpp
LGGPYAVSITTRCILSGPSSTRGASNLVDAAGLVERHKRGGADAVKAAFVAMHVRELVAEQAQLAEKRERLRELQSVIDFAERAAVGKKASV